MSVQYDQYECNKCNTELKVRSDISKGQVFYRREHTRYSLIEQTSSGCVKVYAPKLCPGSFLLISGE